MGSVYTVGSITGRGEELLILGSEVPATEQRFGGVALYLCGRLRGLESGDPPKESLGLGR